MDFTIKRLGKKVNQTLNNTEGVNEGINEEVRTVVEFLYLIEKFADMEREEMVKNLLRAIIDDLEQNREQEIRNKLTDLYKHILNSVLIEEIDGHSSDHIRPRLFVEIFNKAICRNIAGTQTLIIDTYWAQFISNLKIDNGDKALWEYVVRKVNNYREDKNLITLNQSMGVVRYLYERHSYSKMIFKIGNFIRQKNDLPNDTIEIKLYDRENKRFNRTNVLNFREFFISIGNHEFCDFYMNQFSNKKIFMILMMKDNNLIPVNLQTKNKLFVELKINEKYPLIKGDKFILIDQRVISGSYKTKKIVFEVKNILFDKNLELNINSEIRMKRVDLNDEFNFKSSIDKSQFIIGKGDVDHVVLGSTIGTHHAFVEYSSSQWFLINNSKNGVWFVMKSEKDHDIRSRECFLGSHKHFTVFSDSNNKPSKLLEIKSIRS